MMPKMKSHRGANKRFKVTGTGAIRRRQAMRGHLMETKSSRRARRLGRDVDIAPGDLPRIRRLLHR